MPRVAVHLKPWMRNASDELAVRAGCTFDESAGEVVVNFLQTFCRLSEGKWAEQPMRLIPWQIDLVTRLYGWKRPNGTRRYRWCYCEIPKKSGKSPLGSGLACYHLVADGEGGPKIYLNACDRDQARIVFDHAANMVRQSPELAEAIEIVSSANRLVCAENFGSIVANSSVVDSKDGKNASLVINDELHRWKGRALWNVFRYAGASREQPINLTFTTAGESESGVWFEQRIYSEQVNDGTIPDWTHLGVVYRADPKKDELDDPATWAKANPSLGYTLDVDEFRADLEKAKRIPSDLAEFKRFRMNIVTGAATRYLPEGAWKLGDVEPKPLGLRPTFVGIDLASVNDLAAIASIAGDEADGVDAHVRYYLPERSIVELEHQHGQPYRVWADLGLITLTPGAAIDYEWIVRDVLTLCAVGNVSKILLDPANGTWVYTTLRERHGLPIEMVRQGGFTLNDPTKQLLRLVLNGKFRHGGHPILAWNAANARTIRDANDNNRLTKEHSTGKIDGLAATVNAFAGWIAPGAIAKPSIYETRGPRVV